MADNQSTSGNAPEFDFDAYPADTCFHDRRTGANRRGSGGGSKSDSKPVRKERRRRIDPTTFEKQYSPDELEFMNAMQRFKVRTGKTFPSFGDVLRVARSLGYDRTKASSTEGAGGPPVPGHP